MLYLVLIIDSSLPRGIILSKCHSPNNCYVVVDNSSDSSGIIGGYKSSGVSWLWTSVASIPVVTAIAAAPPANAAAPLST